MLAASLPLDEAARRLWGAVVVGAGPAGALAARELARRDVAVLLVDQAEFPRYKVCGCCLNARSLAVLKVVGIGTLTRDCGAIPLSGLRLAVRGGSARLPLPDGQALSRQAFDTALVRSAVAAGAAFLPGTRATLPPEPPGQEDRSVMLHQGAEGARTRARVVLAADGLGGNLLARAGLNAAPATPGSRIGAGIIIATDEPHYRPGTIYMACGPGGYVGLVRLENGALAVAAALDVAEVRAAGGPGGLAARLLDLAGWPVPAPLSGPGWRGTAALTRRARHLSAPRVFVLGDATGYVEPFTGEGMAWALTSAAAVAPLAARAARHWHPDLARAWARRHRRAVTSRQLICRAMAAVLHRPLLTGMLVRVLARVPVLAVPIVRCINALT
jgi:flavin-dependent dehydrogenase